MSAMSDNSINEFKVLLKDVTDIGSCVDSVEQSLQFPGPRLLDRKFYDYVSEVTSKFLEKGITDAAVKHKGVNWRGHHDKQCVDGEWVRLRKMWDVAPRFNLFKTKIPHDVAEFLTSKDHSSGGILLIMGSTGSGKTSTASATVVERLLKNGGVAYTVEDPPEYPIHGWHEDPSTGMKGVCVQSWVQQKGLAPWADAIKGVLRCQPVSTPAILFVGEIREDEAALVAVQAASNGFLVIATSFAASISAGIASFCQRLNPTESSTFADMFCGSVYQSLNADQMLSVKMLQVDTGIRQKIKNGKFSEIDEEVTRQSNQLSVKQRLAANQQPGARGALVAPRSGGIGGLFGSN